MKKALLDVTPNKILKNLFGVIMKKIKNISVILLVAFIVCTSFCFYGCSSVKQQRSTYQIDCTFEDNKISGTETVNFYNHTENAFSSLKFNLFGNAFREDAKFKPIATEYSSKAYYKGNSYGSTNVLSVKSVGENLEFSIGGDDQNILVVELPEKIYPGESVSVTIDFVTTLANVISRTGINEKTVNLGNFYPILCGIMGESFYECVYYSTGDPFYSDCADYDVSITLDSNYTLASSGKQKSKTNIGDKVRYNYEGENIRSFAVVMSKEFKVQKDSSTGVDIFYYYYDDSEPLTALKTAVQSIEFFSQTFGSYPYSTYSVVQTKFIQGGMEYPALSMISDELEAKAYSEVIVHETAHQWWLVSVGNNEIEYGFLDEGLAEYSVVVFYENHSEYGLNRNALIKSSEMTYKNFCSIYDKLYNNVNTTMIRSLDEFSSEYEYVNIAYVKPCIMYDNLRSALGEEKFFNSLRSYYKEFQFKNATPDDLIGAFEKCGLDANGFFQSFFTGKAII